MKESIFLSFSFIQLFADPAYLIQYGGSILLLGIICLKTGFLLGLVLLGGDYLVFTAGLLFGTHYLDVPLLVLVAAMIAAAVLGDFTGYAKGKWLGPKLFNKA
jgi:membrane-associated protein